MEKIDSDSLGHLRRLQIKSVDACTLYYVKERRNAWYQWSSRWYHDSFYFALESAKQFAEDQRVQGSVFSIIEIPAILLESAQAYAIITEIGVDAPLSDYKPPSSIKQVKNRFDSSPYRWRPIADDVPAYIRKQITGDGKLNLLKTGLQLGGAMDSFAEDSLCWKDINTNRSVVNLLAYPDDGVPQLIKQRQKMAGWQSKSVGGSYNLFWNELDNQLSAASVLRIVKNSQKPS